MGTLVVTHLHAALLLVLLVINGLILIILLRNSIWLCREDLEFCMLAQSH